MTISERNNKLKHFITCLKCEVSSKCCNDNCSTQYDAGNMGEIIENLEAILKALEQEPRKGHWVLTDVEGNKVWRCHCSECGKDPQDYVGGSVNWWLIKSKLPKFCPSCGSDNKEVEE